MNEKIDNFSNSILVMFFMSLLSIVIILMYNFILEIVNKADRLTDFFIKILYYFISSKDYNLSVANQYLLSSIFIFLPSFLLFYLIIQQIKKINSISILYTSVVKRCIAYYTVILVFFGFLQLFFSPISIGEVVMGEINNIFIVISLGSLFPYFYLLLDEAKNNNNRTFSNELNKITQNKNVKSKKKRYDNIYFLLSILFLFFICNYLGS